MSYETLRPAQSVCSVASCQAGERAARQAGNKPPVQRLSGGPLGCELKSIIIVAGQTSGRAAPSRADWPDSIPRLRPKEANVKRRTRASWLIESNYQLNSSVMAAQTV